MEVGLGVRRRIPYIPRGLGTNRHSRFRGIVIKPDDAIILLKRRYWAPRNRTHQATQGPP
jgi:hypothetical protein